MVVHNFHEWNMSSRRGSDQYQRRGSNRIDFVAALDQTSICAGLPAGTACSPASQ